MKKPYIIPVIVLVTMLLSCKKDSDEEISTTKEFLPLKTGNTWNFLTTDLNLIQSMHVNKVPKDTMMFGGETWYVLTYDDTIRTLCINKPDGWWFVMTDTQHPDGEPVMYYKYPAYAQEQYWTADSSLVTVVSTSASVTVPAGTFSCYQYHMVHYRENYTCEEYWCPGVGFIKHLIYADDNGTQVLAEVTVLTSYTLK